MGEMAVFMLSEAAVPPPVWSADWWSTFTTSPAFAGLMAVVAALVALAAGRHRIAADRGLAAVARTDAKHAAELVRIAAVEDRDHAAWWEHYRYLCKTMDRIVPADAVRVFEALAEQAPSPVATAFLDVALTEYTRTPGDGGTT